MKSHKHYHFIIIYSLTFILSSCAKVYYTPDAYDLAKRHKLVAIIPSKVTIKAKKNTDMKALQDEQKNEASCFQKEIYAWLLKRKSQKKFRPKIQEIEVTNRELEKIGYPDKMIPNEELCKILGVDAVITTEFNLSHPMSEAAALALKYIDGRLGFSHWGWGATNEVYVTMQIFDAKEEKMIWNYSHKTRGYLGSTPEQLVNRLMRNASKKMPYVKKKRRVKK